MDAKTGSVASDDVFRVARSKHHSYEQVFTTFTTTPQSRFVQSIAPAQDEPLLKQEDDDEDKMLPPQGQQKQPQEQQQKSGSSRSPLFWVNSDPQTVQKGSREQTLKRIRSHVMSEHNRKKRLENTRRYNKSKTWKNLAYRPEPIASSQLSRTVESSISSPSSSSTSDRSSSKSSSSPEIRERSPPNSLKTSRSSSSIKSETSISFSSLQVPTPEALHDQQLSVVSSHEQSSVPKILYSGTEEVDPFHAMQVRLSEAQYQHFKFFLYDLVPQASPFIKHGVEYLRSHWVSLAQSNPAVLYACITSAITNKSLLTGDFFADQATQRKNPLMLDRLRNRGETISLINQNLSSLSSAASDASIAAVAMLISVEVTGSNPQDIAPHLNGLRKMVSLRKNFGDISKWIRLQIEWNDVRSACKTMSKPLFPFIRYTTPQRTPPEVSVENAGKLASALRLLSHIPSVFGVEMCRTIDDLTSLTLYAEIFRFQPKLAAVLFDEEIEEYFNNEVLYTEYCLVNDRWVYHTAPSLSNGTAFSPMADSTSSSRTSGFRLRGDDTIEGAVRLACLLFHNTTIWPFYPAVGPLFPLPIFALETSLRNGIATGTYTYLSDLLIWLLFVGASASKYLPTSRVWFLDELRKAVGQYNTSVISSLNPSANTTFQNNVSLDHHHHQQQQPPPAPTAPALASVEDFRDVLSGFFYTDRFYMANVSEIWTILTQSGSYRRSQKENQ